MKFIAWQFLHSGCVAGAMYWAYKSGGTSCEWFSTDSKTYLALGLAFAAVAMFASDMAGKEKTRPR